MAQVGLTKAAELTGKAASTITRRAKHKDTSKRLSFTISNGGEKLYDIAELERVFGKLKTPINYENSDNNAIVQKSENAIARNDLQQQVKRAHEETNALLHDKIALLQTQLDDTRKDRDEWRDQAKQNSRLLEDQREKPDSKQADKLSQKPTEKKKGFWNRMFGSKE